MRSAVDPRRGLDSGQSGVRIARPSGSVRAMRRVLHLTPLCVLALVAFGVGCAPGNQEACERYVEAQNIAYTECGMEERLKDPEETCPATLNEGLNCVDYYEGLADSFRCENGEVIWETGGSCS